MLSRASFLSAFLGQQGRPILAQAARALSTSSVRAADEPEFRRPVRQEPGKVRLGFVPDEWFTFFYKKTGVTGPYTLGVTLSTYLVSKEIYVLEHEYYTGLSLLIMWVIGIKKLGPKLAAALDKEIDAYEASWNAGRIQEKQILEEEIADELQSQYKMEGQLILIQGKRENVGLQLEAAYRARLLHAYNEVKRRLDYQVEKQNVQNRIAQKNLVDWVVRNVKAALTPDQEKQNIDKCIADLINLSKA